MDERYLYGKAGESHIQPWGGGTHRFLCSGADQNRRVQLYSGVRLSGGRRGGADSEGSVQGRRRGERVFRRIGGGRACGGGRRVRGYDGRYHVWTGLGYGGWQGAFYAVIEGEGAEGHEPEAEGAGSHRILPWGAPDSRGDIWAGKSGRPGDRAGHCL